MTNELAPLQFGMFVMPVHDPAKPLTQCFDEDLELAQRCEEMKFADFWVGEHHSSSYENIVMPEIFIAKALGFTESMRLGPAPVCLAYHHPVHVAGRLAFLDHLSHGRLNVCFGPGAIPTDLEVFDVDPRQSGERVAEAIDMILKIWTSDPPYQMEGRFWRFRIKEQLDPEMGLGTLPKPLQRPYPPVFTPCISRGSRSIQAAAERGFFPISHHMISEEVLIDHWQTYSAAAEAVGREADRSEWSVSRNVFVADTTALAEQLARQNSVGRCIEYILELTNRGPGLAMWKRNAEMADGDCNLDYFMDEVVIAGDPPTVVRKIKELHRRLGGFGKLVLVAHDWDDRSRWSRCLELLSDEVIPALRLA
ncbi:MAG: hypothetical protein CMJ59_13540 [Planctomycetaceae bacterium]|nr:hypothetical protein [Planctomycetaceae bacterium]